MYYILQAEKCKYIKEINIRNKILNFAFCKTIIIQKLKNF